VESRRLEPRRDREPRYFLTDASFACCDASQAACALRPWRAAGERIRRHIISLILMVQLSATATDPVPPDRPDRPGRSEHGHFL